MPYDVSSPEIDSGNGLEYSTHIEPPEQGGARYIRCECCGREVIGTAPNRLLHRDDCVYA